MGWHDNAIVSEGDEEERNIKIMLFWHVYIIERALSFRLGRPSVIRDCDITVISQLNERPFHDPWPGMFSFWVGNANIQGKVYERLYSKAALLGPQTSLSRNSEELMAELESLGRQSPYVRAR